MTPPGDTPQLSTVIAHHDHRQEPEISYRFGQTALPSLDAEVRALMAPGPKRICDVGGGANPVATLTDVGRFGVEYLVLDSSREELAKADPGFETLVIDIQDRVAVERLVAERGPFDLAVSRWTAEHVPHGQAFHQQIHRLLRPGGSAVHLFPTLYSPPFVVNRVLPHALSSALVPWLDRSGRERGGAHEAFRPYYSWCRGPTQHQLDRLASVGFEVRRYVGFFGHPYYARLGPIHRVHERFSRWLVRNPVPLLTSYALVVLERMG